jgi:hypothetical protein
VQTFPQFLEEQGFQADACESCINPDFYRLARSLWDRTRKLERDLDAEKERVKRLARRNLKITEVKLSR